MKRFPVSSYEEYTRKQIGRASKKFTKSNSVVDDFKVYFKTFSYVTNYVPKVCVCMGMRSDGEYKSMKQIDKLRNSEIYGVDIVKEVEKRGKNCFCYDFNNLPKEWENKFDFVTSNSLDHSFDIEKTISEWYRVTKNNGYMLLTFSTSADIGDVDIYQFDTSDVSELFDDNRFNIVKIWDESRKSFNVIVKVKK